MPHNTQTEKPDTRHHLSRCGKDTPMKPETIQQMRDAYCSELESIPQIWKTIMQNMHPAILDHFSIRIRNLAASVKPDEQSYTKVQDEAKWVKFLAFHYTFNADRWEGYPWIFDHSYRLSGFPPVDGIKDAKG